MPATIGLAYLRFAPFASEPEDALPTYKEKIKLGGTVQANLSLTFASGQDYADNVLTEDVNDFVSGSLATEIDHIPLEAEAVIYGSTIDEITGELVDSIHDSPPYGGLVYYQLKQIDSKKVYRGYYYPKARAVLSQDNAQTKNSGVSFQHQNPSFTIFSPNVGKWRYREEFDTEAAVIAWMEGKLGGTPTTP